MSFKKTIECRIRRKAAIACDAECDSEDCLLILIEVRPLISMIAMSDGVFRTNGKV